MQIILASTSPYRAQQLRDLGIRFRAVSPPFDEETFKREHDLSPKMLAQHLACEKAMSVFTHLNSIRRRPRKDAVVIGADQLVCLENKILGKPGGRSRAIGMLTKMQGRRHQLITSVCVIDSNGKKYEHTEIVDIKMRRLTRKQIVKYVAHDKPYDCAGSYRLEKGGLALVKQMKVQDPSSLVGLPLMALTDILLRIKGMSL